MLEVIKKDVRNLQYASERLKDNSNFIVAVVNNYEENLYDYDDDFEFFSYVSNRIKNDRDVMFSVVCKHPRILQHASNELRDDKEFILSLLNSDSFFVCRCFQYASNRLKDDKDVVKAAISKSGNNIAYISQRFKNDKSMLLSANNIPLEFVAEQLKEDRDIILASINKGTDFDYDPDAILSIAMTDREILLALVKNSPRILSKIPDDIKKDKELILSAVSRFPDTSIRYIPKEFIYDREVVLTALKAVTGKSIGYFPRQYKLDNLPTNLKDDKEIIITLVNVGHFMDLENVPEKFKDDKDVARAYIKNAPWQIKSLSNKLKHDKEFLLELITDPKILSEAKIYLEPTILEDIMQEDAMKKQTNEEYPLYLLNNITASQEVFKQEQNDCVNYIRLLKEFNSYDIGSEEKGPILDKMQLSPCYRSYILGIGQYGKYKYEIVSPEVKKIFKVCEELLELYTRESNKVIDFYIEDGYEIIKKSLIQYLSKKEQISLYDRIICETLVSNILKQIQLLQIGILSKNDEKLNDTMELFEELLTNDLNQLKNYSISRETETVDNKKHH